MDQADPLVVLFDGVCNLCNAWVLFVIRRDPTGRFKFASLQSDAGRDLLRRFGDSPEAMDTVVLIAGDKLLVRSDAVLEIARGLKMPWPSLYALKIVPRFLRDACYGIVARYRYTWFGRKDVCMVPTPELRRRFLE